MLVHPRTCKNVVDKPTFSYTYGKWRPLVYFLTVFISILKYPLYILNFPSIQLKLYWFFYLILLHYKLTLAWTVIPLERSLVWLLPVMPTIPSACDTTKMWPPQSLFTLYWESNPKERIICVPETVIEILSTIQRYLTIGDELSKYPFNRILSSSYNGIFMKKELKEKSRGNIRWYFCNNHSYIKWYSHMILTLRSQIV